MKREDEELLEQAQRRLEKRRRELEKTRRLTLGRVLEEALEGLRERAGEDEDPSEEG